MWGDVEQERTRQEHGTEAKEKEQGAALHAKLTGVENQLQQIEELMTEMRDDLARAIELYVRRRSGNSMN
jgi:archaellum component FlaC